MQRNTTRHPKAQHATARRDATRHRAAHHGAARRNTARPSRAHRSTARPTRRSTAKHRTTQHSAPQHTTTSKQGTLAEGLTKSSHRTPPKEPHQPATHRQRATAHPATTVEVHRHKPPPESTNQHRGDERTQLTQGHREPPDPAEPEPNPAGRGAEPSVYKPSQPMGPGHGLAKRNHQQQTG